MEKRNPEADEDPEGDDVQNTEPDVYNEVPAESGDEVEPGGQIEDTTTSPPDELQEQPSRTVEGSSDEDDVGGPVKGEQSGSREGVHRNQ